MFSSIKEWLQKQVALQFVKNLLDLLPLDGKKTYLGLILFLLSYLSQQVPAVAAYQVVMSVMQLLKDMGAENLDLAAALAVVLGLVHKAIKAIYSSKEQAEAIATIEQAKRAVKKLSPSTPVGVEVKFIKK